MAEITTVAAGVYRITDRGRSRVAYAARAREGIWIFLDGHTYVVNGPDGGAKRASLHDETALAAPMPAAVAAINVVPGQRVLRGDVLIVLEAMKMELPIKAPRDGVVRAVACRPGELVQPGVPLVELE